MRKLLLAFFLFTIPCSFLSAQNLVSQEDQEQIKQVISAETKLFYARKLSDWKNLWRQTPSSYWALIEKNNRFQKEGWDNISKFMEKYYQENKAASFTFKRENTNFRKVNPTYLWVTFDQTRIASDGKKDFFKELRILELIKGEWKIVNMTSVWMPGGAGIVKEEAGTGLIPKPEEKPKPIKAPEKSLKKEKTEEKPQPKKVASGRSFEKLMEESEEPEKPVEAEKPKPKEKPAAITAGNKVKKAQK